MNNDSNGFCFIYRAVFLLTSGICGAGVAHAEEFRASDSDGQCPAGYELASSSEARANSSAACNVLGKWYIARLAGGGSMDGRGYNCKIRNTDSRSLGNSLCKKTSNPCPTNNDPVEALWAYLSRPKPQRPQLGKCNFTDTPLTKSSAKTAKTLIWQDHQKKIRSERQKEVTTVRDKLGNHNVYEMRIGDKTMPYIKNTYGQVPTGGRPLLIMLHGGGAVSNEDNLDNWRGYLTPYKPDGAITVSPRSVAPDWNMWFKPDAFAFIKRLIENMIVFEKVNPDRVYIAGYSAGGDGVYHLAPEMADYWAGALMAAGHPNNARAESLMNTRFAIAMGDRDSAYNRNGVARQWKEKLDSLQKKNGKFIHRVSMYPTGHPMGGRERADVTWMMQGARTKSPAHILWNTRGGKRFYWLLADQNGMEENRIIDAKHDGNQFTLSGVKKGTRMTIRFNDQMIDFSEPVTIVNSDTNKSSSCTPRRSINVIVETIAERGDPTNVYTGSCSMTFED